jgi:hypothetical protein
MYYADILDHNRTIMIWNDHDCCGTLMQYASGSEPIIPVPQKQIDIIDALIRISLSVTLIL